MDDLFPATSMPDRNWWAALWPRPTDVLEQLGIRPGMTVLDLCCGDGYFTAPLAKLVDGRIYALDLDLSMIERAKVEVARLAATVRQWINADAREIASLLDEPIDYVLMANTFHGVPDQPGLARAVWHVLRPGGLFAIVNWHPLPREETVVLGKPRGPRTDMRMSHDAVSKVVEPVGFRTVRVEELPPYHYGVILERMG
ncbi:class I SAM-dependent methyltransferase [Rhizobium calliandrae]|uniref:Class I SAM-dependent methyltransferase n=1 Tax=Rhizobium calliandrae TaxID=1312182 RepID=A0ABT7KN98_9HYPH|nr:class I SAM-dependent methyltransferase [Rhizobium calliandrae]MDL2409413.1 class I SAM-dependent methyltransferase [Rhizobium calliandrae]